MEKSGDIVQNDEVESQDIDMASQNDEVEVQEEDYQLILNAEDGMDFELGRQNDISKQETSNISSEVGNLLTEDDLINTTFNSATGTNCGDGEFHSPEEIELLLKSPHKKVRPHAVMTGDGGAIKIIAPAYIEDCVELRVNNETNERSYYNNYYSAAIKMTKDRALWDKVRRNDFAENEVRPIVIEIILPSKEELVKLYSSLHLYKNEFNDLSIETVDSDYRLNCVLIRGVNGMSTQGIFLYLRLSQQFPVQLEWINDAQCNLSIAVFANKMDAGRCILELSKPIVTTSDTRPLPEDIVTEFDLVDNIPVTWVKVPMPKSHTWRFTVSFFHDKKAELGFLMTYPKQSDKKPRNAEFFSDYYREHGNPHWNEVPSLWTKTGYEAKIIRKRYEVQLQKEWRKKEALKFLTDEDKNVGAARLPAKCRLGVPVVNSESGSGSFEDKKIVPSKDKYDDHDYRYNQPHTSSDTWAVGSETDTRRKRCWNGYKGGMVADAEEEFCRRKYLRPNSDDGKDRHRKSSISIKDRLGW